MIMQIETSLSVVLIIGFITILIYYSIISPKTSSSSSSSSSSIVDFLSNQIIKRQVFCFLVCIPPFYTLVLIITRIAFFPGNFVTFLYEFYRCNSGSLSSSSLAQICSNFDEGFYAALINSIFLYIFLVLFVGGTLYYDIGLHVNTLDRVTFIKRCIFLIGTSCIFGPIFGFLIHYCSKALTISIFPSNSSISILAGFTTLLGYIRSYIIEHKNNVVIRPAPPQIYLDTIYHLKRSFFNIFDTALKSCILSFMLTLCMNLYMNHMKSVSVYYHSFRQSLYVRFVLLLIIDTMHYLMKSILFFPMKFSSLNQDDVFFANLIATGLPRRRKVFSWQDSSQSIDRHHSTWQEARDVSKATADEMLDATETNVYGPPRLPFLASRRSRASAWGQCLAVQDLLTVARTCTDRRLKLIQPRGQWSTIAWALCGIVDAITLQLQLIVAQVVEDIILTETGKFNDSEPKPQGAQLVGDAWSGAIPWSARDIVSKKKRNTKRFFIQDIYFKIFGEFSSADFLDLDPLPSATAQLGIHAMESISIILQKALREDNSGIPQYHLAAIISSLLALDEVLNQYASAITRVRSVDKKLRSQKRFSRSVGLMPKELQALHKVTNESLSRIIKCYSDLIITYTFPPVYANNLSARIKKIDIM